MITLQPQMTYQAPISLSGRSKTDVRSQFATLCYRLKKNKKPEILLITSRASKRWIIPKGWPMEGKTPIESASLEAWEEAGVRGRSDGRCIGIFSYSKDADALGELPCLVMVFAIEVSELSNTYPEAGERERLWLSRKKAAKRVDEPDLARIIRDFEPAPRR